MPLGASRSEKNSTLRSMRPTAPTRESILYEEAKSFMYHPKWTGPLFKVMSFIIRIMCLDSHDEQVAAWKALVAAGFPPQATALFSNMNAVGYKDALEKFRPALGAANRIQEVQLARELGDQFRAQYRAAEQLAKAGK